MSAQPVASLLQTLSLALQQCHDQTRLFDERGKRIEEIQAENRRLKQELTEFKAQSHSHTGDGEQNRQDHLERLFEDNVRKQYEIDRLKSQLKSIRSKLKTQGVDHAISPSSLLRSPCTSSPALRTTGRATLDEPIPPRNISEGSRAAAADPQDNGIADRSPIVRKRARSQSPQPLRETTGNAKHRLPRDKDDIKRKRKSDTAITAIPAIAEDGEEYGHGTHNRRHDNILYPTGDIRSSKLEALLSGPVPVTPLLKREQSVETPSGLEASEPVRVISSKFSPRQAQFEAERQHSNARPSIPISIARKPAEAGPEDDEPLRVRPVRRLNLSDFKINPSYNGGLDYAFNEVVRGREARKCLPGCTRPQCCGNKFRALASTLPSLTGVQVVSDDELLRQYLGPDSDQRIQGLTRVARENLLHDARTKLLADKFGKQHRNAHERQRSPTGFWATDMPGSQEHQKLREAGKLRQQEEIQRRYEDAMRGGGRWSFADE